MGFDNDFCLTSLKVNDADPVTCQYDQDSLLSQAGAMSLGRNAQNGMMTETTLGGVTDSYVYNELNDRSCLLGSIHGYDCTFLEVGIMVQQKAALDKRIIAFLIDWVALCCLQSMIIGVFLLPNIRSISSSLLISSIVTATIITFSINLLKDSVNGMGLGKRIMKIGIRKEENSTQIPSIVQLVIRNLFIILWPIEVLLLAKNGKRLGDTVTKTDVYSI